MTPLTHHIQILPDADAQRILSIFVSNQPGYHASSLSPDLVAALQQVPDLTATAASPGDLARAALLLLADVPEQRSILEAMASQPPAQRFGVLETTVVVSAVLFVLGTHLHIERTTQGAWSLMIDKKPTDPGLLKLLLEKLLGWSKKDADS